MNMETSNTIIVGNWLNLRRYCSRVVGAVRATARRLRGTIVSNEMGNMGQACAEKEQYHSEAVAQLQSVRYFR